MIEMTKREVAQGFLWALSEFAKLRNSEHREAIGELGEQYTILTASVIGEKATLQCIRYMTSHTEPDAPTLAQFLDALTYED